MAKLLVGCLLSVALVVAAGREQLRAEDKVTPGTQEQTLVHDKLTRKYQLHVPPSYRPTKPVPLVLLLHGQKGTGLNLLRKGWAEKADREGFVAVAPDATGDPSAWNSGYNHGRNLAVDDVAFLRTLLDRVEGRLAIDPKRVSVAGLSSGAMMSYRLAAELSDLIAAVGPVAGSIGASLKDRDGEVVRIPDPKGPVSVIAIHGKADTHVPYEGSKNRPVNFLPTFEGRRRLSTPDGPGQRESPRGTKAAKAALAASAGTL